MKPVQSRPAAVPSGASGGGEQLISMAVISCGQPDRDIETALMLADLAKAHTAFFEILILAASPAQEWVRAIRENSGQVANINVLLFDPSYIDNFDKLTLAAMTAAIGDCLLVTIPGEFSRNDVAFILAQGFRGERAIIKICYTAPDIGMGERLALRVFGRFMWMTARHILLRYPSRTLFVTRSAMTKILSNPTAFKYVRILDTGRFLQEEIIEKSPVVKPKPLWGLRRKLGIAADLSSSAAPRFLALFSVLSAAMSAMGLVFAVYVVLIMLLKSDVAPGWFSTSLVISVMFMMVFALLSLVALGITRIINLQEDTTRHEPLQEISSSVLFANLQDLNVELKGSD